MYSLLSTTYHERTCEFRPSLTPSQPNQLLISYRRPHAPVKSCSIARWIKSVLSKAGIDTSICQSARRVHICESTRISPLLTWVQFPLGTTYDSYVRRVSHRSAESCGFSPGTPVSSHREC